MLKKTSLKPVSVHLNDKLFIHQPEKLQTAMEDAQKHGL